jgi:quaternary ammonium compound-resistance protein SugE
MAWIFLLLAGACEMVWPLGFKYTNGFKTHFGFVALTFAIMILSFWLMSVATNRGIHVGTAYAVWTGLGAAGTAILGMILFNEPRDAIRISCLVLIIAGAVGLKFFSPPTAIDSTQVAIAGPVSK